MFDILSSFSIAENITIFTVLCALMGADMLSLVLMGFCRSRRRHLNRKRDGRLHDDEQALEELKEAEKVLLKESETRYAKLRLSVLEGNIINALKKETQNIKQDVACNAAALKRVSSTVIANNAVVMAIKEKVASPKKQQSDVVLVMQQKLAAKKMMAADASQESAEGTAKLALRWTRSNTSKLVLPVPEARQDPGDEAVPTPESIETIEPAHKRMGAPSPGDEALTEGPPATGDGSATTEGSPEPAARRRLRIAAATPETTDAIGTTDQVGDPDRGDEPEALHTTERLLDTPKHSRVAATMPIGRNASRAELMAHFALQARPSRMRISFQSPELLRAGGSGSQPVGQEAETLEVLDAAQLDDGDAGVAPAEVDRARPEEVNGAESAAELPATGGESAAQLAATGGEPNASIELGGDWATARSPESPHCVLSLQQAQGLHVQELVSPR
eukprot:1326733-Prymnesium_polylepis.1